MRNVCPLTTTFSSINPCAIASLLWNARDGIVAGVVHAVVAAPSECRRRPQLVASAPAGDVCVVDERQPVADVAVSPRRILAPLFPAQVVPSPFVLRHVVQAGVQ